MKKLKKIVMIGPVYPYKGGISHYTGLMYNALDKKYDVSMISYKMQYPKFMFKKEQRDYDNDTLKIDDTKYWIHTANPINCIAIANKIKKMKPDLVIFQWWHPYFAPCYWLMEKALGRKLKKLFVCHNVFPHERFPMDKLLTKLVLKNGHYFITHSEVDSNDLLSIKKQACYRKTVLPVFNMFKLKNMTKQEARSLLNISNEEKILLFFGFVRDYKGLKHIINALPEVKQQLDNVRLYIVGDFGTDKQKYMDLIEEKQVEDQVKIFDGYTPDREVEKFFAASDLVVLPYESATQSGIVQIAYGFCKPVVVTNVGGLPEVVKNGQTGYVVEAKNPIQLSKAIVGFFLKDNAEIFKENIIKEDYKYSWDRLTECVEMLYEQKQ